MPNDEARELCALYPEVYLRLHARAPKAKSRLTQQSWGVLQHLAMAGPLTIGEMARHLDRAQSVVSEIVDGMEKKRLVERMPDARDRRRTLVWLTDDGLAAIEEGREVLSRERVEASLAAMSAADRTKLLHGLRALVRAADVALTPKKKGNAP